MAKKEKEFNLKLYGIFSIVVVAVILVVLTVFAFTTRYNGFNPEKIAVTYVDTIVQTGDGYDAYKNTLLSKDSKFGDYIRQNYIYPAVYEGYKPGDSTKDLKGLNDDELKGEKSLNDDGTLEGKLIDAMYPVFVQLVTDNNGFDNYDLVFSSYVAKLKETRAEIFGDTFFDDETFFGAFEANLSTYGESLTGTEDKFDKNTGVQIKFESTGAYQEKYGDDYKISVVSTGVDGTDTKKTVTVNVLVNGKVEIENLEISVVKVGKTWYVDSSACDTSVLYNFYK